MLNPPLAFGFLNAALLGWLAAAAAPILIHLWMKRVRRETPWAAVRFLQAAIKRHAQRLRIQEWILLAIRTAIILLVVLAASKPVLDSLGGLLGAGVRTHRVLVIDASLSMRYRANSEGGADGSCFERARTLATQLVDQSRPGDSFSVCVMADPPTTPLSTPTTDAGAARRAIASIDPTDGSASAASAFAAAGEVLKIAQSSGARADRREVLFFSDLTSGTWRESTDDTPGVDRVVSELSEEATLTVVDVGDPDATNGAAIELTVDSGAPTLREPIRVHGSVRRFGSGSAAETVPVELLVDGVSVASRDVELSAADPTEVEFTHRFRRPGWRAVSLRLLSDGLATDDQRRLAVNVKPYVSVLCVEGARGAARYVADALNPTGGDDSPIEPRVISDAEFATVDLDDFDAVVMCNVADLTAGEATRLEQFVQGGGGVAFFLGDRVRSDRYNRSFGAGTDLSSEAGDSPFRLAAVRQSPSLLPVEIGSPVSRPVSGIDPLDYRHPIIAPFRGRERAGLLTTPIDRYHPLRRRAGVDDSAIVFRAAGGDALMVATPLGAGRVVVVATAASLSSVDPATGRPWTAMPAWPSFVPILREIIRYATSVSPAQPVVGQPIGGPLAGVTGTRLAVTRPDATTEAIEVGPGESEWVYERTDAAGVYAISANIERGDVDEAAAAQLFAVNTPTAESDLTRVDANLLPEGVRVRMAALEASDDTPELTRSVGVHRGLLVTALGLVLLETVLASRFGRGAA